MNGQNMPECPKCGKENPIDSVDCQHCGIVFSKYKKTEERNVSDNIDLLTTCRACKKEISKNAISCPHCGEPDVNNINNVQGYSPSAINYASLGKRFVGFVIDMTLVFIVTLIFAAANRGDPGLQDAVRGMFIFTLWIYYSAMEGSPAQGSIGKILMKIKVTDLDGNRIGVGRAIGHGFARIFSSMFFGIGYIMALFTEKNQCLHDQAAKCIVVNR